MKVSMIIVMNNKALVEFLNDVYEETNRTILTDKEIKDIEKFYKENREKVETFEEFLSINSDISKKIKKVKGVYAEIERQFDAKKALQPGTLVECNLAQTIANMYNLTTFVDSFHSYIRELPANVLPYLRAEENTLLCRYIYYDPNNYKNFLIQYGNPTSYDADLFLDNKVVRVEFKDRIARAGERDIKRYDELGKLIIDNKFIEENPDYIPLIEKFNEETDIFSRYNSDCEKVNFDDFDEETKKELLKNYFTTLGIDTLVTLDKNNQLIAITKDCLDENKAVNIISTNGSEIRPAGKNPGKVFTPKFLEKSIINMNGKIENNIAFVPKEKMIDRIGRGTGGKVTGKKINNLLFVTIENISEENDKCIFSLENVMQLKPTVAVHIQIIATKEELKKYYNSILENSN